MHAGGDSCAVTPACAACTASRVGACPAAARRGWGASWRRPPPSAWPARPGWMPPSMPTLWPRRHWHRRHTWWILPPPAAAGWGGQSQLGMRRRRVSARQTCGRRSQTCQPAIWPMRWRRWASSPPPWQVGLRVLQAAAFHSARALRCGRCLLPLMCSLAAQRLTRASWCRLAGGTAVHEQATAPACQGEACPAGQAGSPCPASACTPSQAGEQPQGSSVSHGWPWWESLTAAAHLHWLIHRACHLIQQHRRS